MENRSCVHFEHPEEEMESEEERQLSRISMFFNIDISKRNQFRRNLSSERKPRNPGGGLFGAVEDRYLEESAMSLTVPNMFFAESRNFTPKYKYSKYSNEQRKKATMRYESQNEPYSDCYPKYNTRRTHRRNRMESYECPRRFTSHHEERNHNYCGYNDYNEKSRHESYRKKPHQHVLRETAPEFDYDSEYATERSRAKKRRYEKQHEGNLNFYNAFYNCDTPSKFADKLYRQQSTECSQYTLARLNKRARKGRRQSSGCINTECGSAYNFQDYYNLPQNYADDFDSEYEYYDSAKSPNRQSYYHAKPIRQFDSDFYDDPDLYTNRMPKYRKKSVDFFSHDCEIPYNILKMNRNCPRSRKHKNKYMESQSRVGLSSIEIPHKHKHGRYKHSDMYETDIKRSDSGCDICNNCIDPCLAYNYEESFHAHNPLVRRNRRQCCETSDRHYRKSLKEKISGFFKKSKSKSRTKCSQNPHTQYGCGYQDSVLNMKLKRSKVSLDKSQSVSSISCIVVKSRKVPGNPAKNLNKKTKCTAYPTNYRDKCAHYDCQEDELQLYSPSKVNTSQFDCENNGISKCSSEYSRYSAQHMFQESVTGPDPMSAKDLCDFDIFEPNCGCSVQENSAISTSKKDEPPSCCCSAENIPHSSSCAPLEESTPCSCSTMPKVKTQNPTQHSTINLCLTICTADGNLIKPTKVTTTLVEPGNNQCNDINSRTQTTGIESEIPRHCCCDQILPSTSSSKTLLGTYDCEGTDFYQNLADPNPNKSSSVSGVTKKARTTTKKVSVSDQPARICGLGILKQCNSGSDCNCQLPAKERVRVIVTPCQSETNTTCTENEFRCVRCGCVATNSSPSPSQTFKKTNSIQNICPARRLDAESSKCNPYKRKSSENGNKDNWDEIPRMYKVRTSTEKCCCKKPSPCICSTEKVEKVCVAAAEKKSKMPATKVEPVCASNPLWRCQEACGNPCCPKLISVANTNCECRDSFVENLKRELLDTLRSEQQSNAQLQFQRPTSHVMFLPCVSDTISPTIPNIPNAFQPETCRKGWAPL